MVSHLPAVSRSKALDVYDSATQKALDDYKHGDISENDAYYAVDQAIGLLSNTLRSNFLVRLRNLESFRTSRGQDVPSQSGR